MISEGLVYLDNSATSFPKPQEVQRWQSRQMMKWGVNARSRGVFISKANWKSSPTSQRSSAAIWWYRGIEPGGLCHLRAHCLKHGAVWPKLGLMVTTCICLLLNTTACCAHYIDSSRCGVLPATLIPISRKDFVYDLDQLRREFKEVPTKISRA